ncbi:stage IV sporulation protein A [Bacillus sp. JJ1521]|uniref:stage IV sporulation protein A n=1 Tax=Bacillus sp. JJ1521 TaxID=3122957 RepID=UPI002FFDAB4D
MEVNVEISNLFKRFNGSLVVTVTGPTRTGKSLFITNVLKTFVLPNVEETENVEINFPVSESGREISTKKTTIIPLEKIRINIGTGSKYMQFIDCIGYKAHGVKGFHTKTGPLKLQLEGYKNPIHFKEAISIQTREIAKNISDVTIIVTTDGTIDCLPSYAFIDAEMNIVEDLDLQRPKVMILNSTIPEAENTITLAKSLEMKYKLPVIPLSIAEITEENVQSIFNKLYEELPLFEVNVNISEWIIKLETDHFLRNKIEGAVRSIMKDLTNIGKIDSCLEKFKDYDFIQGVTLTEFDSVTGILNINLLESEEIRTKFANFVK